MRWKILVTGCLVTATMALTAGCGGENDAPSSRVAAPVAGEPETIVKTMDEYREEAAKEITVENAKEEMARIEKEIGSDLEAEE